MTSSSSLCRTVDGVERVVVRYATETGTHSVKLCIIGLVIDIPVVVVHVQVVDNTVVAQRAVSVGPLQQTTEIPQLQSIDKVFDVPLVHVQQILGCRL